MSFCFGREYSDEDRLCRMCDVRKECKEAMLESTKPRGEVTMPCFGKYEGPPLGDNYACKLCCLLMEKCKEETLATSSQSEPPVSEPVATPTVEPPPLVFTGPLVSAKLDTILKEPTPPRPTSGAPSKKGIVRQGLRESGSSGISADDLVQRMIDAGVVKDTESERKKNREYVSLCVSELRKQEGMVVIREGDRYVKSS